MPRSYQAIAAIVAFAAEDRNLRRPGRGTSNKLTASIRHASSSRFHKLKAGDAEALGGQAVDLAHLGSSEHFHGNSGLESRIKVKSTETQSRDTNQSIQPPLTLTTWPVTYSASSDAKNATAPATSSTVGGRPIGKRASRMRRASSLVNAGRIDHIDSDTILRLFQGQ